MQTCHRPAHGRRSVGGQGDMSPLLFEMEGTPCVLSPLLSGVDIFCNVQLHSNSYSLQFISPDMWPANSPDLNPVLDYRIWGMLQGRVYRVPICDTDKLGKRLVATWAEFQHSMMDDAVDQW